MPIVALTPDSDIELIIGDLWMFNPKMNGSYAKELCNHFVKLHKEGKIQIITDNLLEKDTWDATLKIDIKDMSAYGVVNSIITPLQKFARFDEIRMLDNNVIEFWWD
jgi:hypothetical protein